MFHVLQKKFYVPQHDNNNNMKKKQKIEFILSGHRLLSHEVK